MLRRLRDIGKIQKCSQFKSCFKRPFWRMSPSSGSLISLIFNLDMYFLRTLWFPKFETDRIFVRVIVITPQQWGKSEEFQGEITQFCLTDFAHIQSWSVFFRDQPISKVWNGSDKIFVIVATPRKWKKNEEIQGQITQFRLTDLAHIRTTCIS